LRAAFQFRLKSPYPAPLARPLLLDEEDPRADDALPLELLGRGSLPLEKLPSSSVKRKTAPLRFFVVPAFEADPPGREVDLRPADSEDLIASGKVGNATARTAILNPQ
jgi:hypothetical protein